MSRCACACTNALHLPLPLLVQDSKSTLFLVLEMAAGGELFDHVGADHEAATAAAAAMDGGSGGGCPERRQLHE